MLLLTAVLASWGCNRTPPKGIPVSVTDQQGGQNIGEAQAASGSPTTPATKTPLLLLDEEPLLLDDNNPLGDTPSGLLADNSRCHVCHMNYLQEDIALVHARANIGCADCHGSSDAHIADESWSWGENGTPPGIMYRRDEINSSCMKCHPKDQICPEGNTALLDDAAQQVSCTDCHGQHRLARRQCKWK